VTRRSAVALRSVAVATAVLVLAAVAASRPPAASADPARPPWLPRRALWIEVSANLPTLSSRDAIRALVARAREAGFDTLVPEAKNAWGFVIYESAFAPHIRTSPVARPFPPAYPPPPEWYPADFDALAVLIEEAHAVGVRVHAAVNVFGEGLVREGVGKAFDRPEWQSVHVMRAGEGTGVRFVPASGAPGTIVYANPAHPEVQLYELAVLWEIVSQYAVDGIVLDRARYADLTADFSDLSRARFEAVLGRPIAGWPEEIVQVSSDGTMQPGPLFTSWVAWRASVIREFVRAAERVVHQVRPEIPLAMYVGAWYPTVFEVGQNWARADAPPLFAAWSPAWSDATLLPHLDYVLVGLYYRAVSRGEAVRQGAPPWRSVTGGALLAREVTRGTPVVGGIWLQVYAGDRDRGRGALHAAAELTDGLMVFDLSDIVEGDWWEAVPQP